MKLRHAAAAIMLAFTAGVAATVAGEYLFLDSRLRRAA
jgi:hypothetical protein